MRCDSESNDVRRTLHSRGKTIKQLASQLMSVPVRLRYFADPADVDLLNIFNLIKNKRDNFPIAGMHCLTLNHSRLGGVSRVVKALGDRVLGSALFLVFLPLMLLIACLVRCRMGAPVLFKQHRHGLDGKRFRIYKFRTETQHTGDMGLVQKSQRHSRPTRLGTWLRHSSLDELPQLYNVLQGRMSLVGPRPHAMDHNEYYKKEIAGYMQRHCVMPGMTGWAQVNGLRGITDDLDAMRKRIDYDLHYIENWSLRMDLKILAMTVTRGFINPQPATSHQQA